jgi:flagellar biosynthesis/type III secretory pathway M-ring protein FliF/YscJ
MSDTEPPANSGYETTDVNPGTLLAWVGLLAAVIVFSVVAAWVFFDVFAERAARRDPKVSPLAPAESQVPPEPRLLVKEHDDLVAVRKEEQERLDTYGWVDKERGIVRIPIARAMELVAKEGLQSRPSPSSAP